MNLIGAHLRFLDMFPSGHKHLELYKYTDDYIELSEKGFLRFVKQRRYEVNIVLLPSMEEILITRKHRHPFGINISYNDWIMELIARVGEGEKNT